MGQMRGIPPKWHQHGPLVSLLGSLALHQGLAGPGNCTFLVQFKVTQIAPCVCNLAVRGEGGKTGFFPLPFPTHFPTGVASAPR